MNGELTLPGDFTEENYGKYFLNDTDFIQAVHKCLDGEGEVASEPPALEEEKPVKPLMDVKIDGAFLEGKEKEAERTMAREKLLDRQFDQQNFLPGQYIRFTFKPIKEFL